MRTSLEAGASHVADKVWFDYPPGYIYLLETVGFLWKLFTRGDLPPDSSLAMRFLLKLLPITADLSGAWALYRIALPRLGLARALAAVERDADRAPGAAGKSAERRPRSRTGSPVPPPMATVRGGRTPAATGAAGTPTPGVSDKAGDGGVRAMTQGTTTMSDGRR